LCKNGSYSRTTWKILMYQRLGTPILDFVKCYILTHELHHLLPLSWRQCILASIVLVKVLLCLGWLALVKFYSVLIRSAFQIAKFCFCSFFQAAVCVLFLLVLVSTFRQLVFFTAFPGLKLCLNLQNYIPCDMNSKWINLILLQLFMGCNADIVCILIHQQLSAPTWKSSPIHSCTHNQSYKSPSTSLTSLLHFCISITETQTCLQASSLSAYNILHSAHISSDYTKKILFRIMHLSNLNNIRTVASVH